jgi:hypothetical protein
MGSGLATDLVVESVSTASMRLRLTAYLVVESVSTASMGSGLADLLPFTKTYPSENKKSKNQCIWNKRCLYNVVPIGAIS